MMGIAMAALGEEKAKRREERLVGLGSIIIPQCNFILASFYIFLLHNRSPLSNAIFYEETSCVNFTLIVIQVEITLGNPHPVRRQNPRDELGK